MDRRTFLARGAALAAAGLPALAAGTAQAAPRPAGLLAPAAAPAAAPASTLPSGDALLTVLRRVADHWIATHADPGDNLWANATFMSGLMALQRLTGDSRYLAYVRGWAENHGYGLNGGTTTRDADNQCAGQAYLDLYEAEPDASRLTAIEACLHRMTYSDQVGKNDDWWWDDALHMAMPQFARLGALRGDSGYYDKMHRLYQHTKSSQGGPGLFDPGSGLWYRDANFLPGGILSPSGRPVLWSRGNGWVAGAHTKVLKALPAGHADAAEYRDTLTRLVTAVAQVQRSDGFWNVNLADPGHFPGPETSGTSFFAYGTAYAVGAGLVDGATYLPVAARAWNGLVATAVHPDGVLGYVQKVGDRPDSSQPVTYDSTADFAVGGFLLAGAELAGLTTPPDPATSGAPGSTITLRARANGKFVTADNAGASPLIANRAEPQGWETFDVLDAGGGAVALRAHANNKIVTAEDAGVSPLVANRATVSGWETFRLVHNANGSISLLAAVNNRYVTAENTGASPLVANRATIGSWEQFDVNA